MLRNEQAVGVLHADESNGLQPLPDPYRARTETDRPGAPHAQLEGRDGGRTAVSQAFRKLHNHASLGKLYRTALVPESIDEDGEWKIHLCTWSAASLHGRLRVLEMGGLVQQVRHTGALGQDFTRPQSRRLRLCWGASGGAGRRGQRPVDLCIDMQERRFCAMPTCRECDNEVDALKTVKVGGKKRKMCEDCADRLEQESEIAEQSEGVVQEMMGFKGRRS